MADIYGTITNNIPIINFIHTFTLTDSIKNKISLPFKYYMTPLSILNDNDENKKIDKIIDIINKVIVSEELHYQKFVVWCGSIKKAEYYYNKIGIKFKNKYGFSIFVDHSKTEDIKYIEDLGLISSKDDFNLLKPNEYSLLKKDDSELYQDGILKYNKTASRSILFVSHKCREGCNLFNVDCGIYLEGFKTKGVLIRMQSSGRINRIAEHKKYANIIEFVDDSKVDSIYSKIIHDIKDLYDYTLNQNQFDLNEIDDAFNFLQFIDNVRFENGQIITDGFVFDSAFIPIINYDNVRTTIINAKLENIKKEKKKWFEYCLKVMKTIFKFDIDTNFEKDYDIIENKRGLPDNLNEFYNEFKEYLDSRTLYEWLEINTTHLKTTKELCKIFLIDQGINIKSDEDYYNACLIHDCLPKDPRIFYGIDNFRGIKQEFTKRIITREI